MNPTTTTTAALREAALAAAARGWPVFPLRPGTKIPAIPDWQTRATTEQAGIVAAWRRPCNIGIACGPAGLVVLDSDMPTPDTPPPPPRWCEQGVTTGEDVLTVLADEAGQALPETYMVRTPSGGIHRYYQAPDGLQLGNTQKRLGWLLDTRGEGGQVAAAGSTTREGRYELVDTRAPVDLPGWILQRLVDTPRERVSAPPDTPASIHPAYATAALHREARRVATAKSGTHNGILNTAAFNLGQLIGDGALAYDEVREELFAAAEHMTTSTCDCTQSQIEAVIAYGIAAGAANPRSRRGHAA